MMAKPASNQGQDPLSSQARARLLASFGLVEADRPPTDQAGAIGSGLSAQDWQAVAAALVDRMSESPEALDALAQALSRQWRQTELAHGGPVADSAMHRYRVLSENRAASQSARSAATDSGRLLQLAPGVRRR